MFARESTFFYAQVVKKRIVACPSLIISYAGCFRGRFRRDIVWLEQYNWIVHLFPLVITDQKLLKETGRIVRVKPPSKLVSQLHSMYEFKYVDFQQVLTS